MRILRIVLLSLIFLSFLTLFSIYACESPVTGNGGNDDDEEINPQQPRDLTVTFHGTYVKLEWKASENAEEIGYEILRSGLLLGAVNNDVFTFVDDTFEKGYYYDYWVRTVYEGGYNRSTDAVEIYTGYLWYMVYGDDIYKYDINSGEEVLRLPRAGGNSGLTWDGNYLWFSETDPGKINKVDPETGEIIFSFPSVYDYAGGLAYDGEYLWSVDTYTYDDEDPWWWDFDVYVRHDLNTGGYVTYGKDRGRKALTCYGDYLWAIEESPYGIVVIDLDTMEEVRRIELPGWPRYSDFAHDGRYLWISFEGNIYKANENGVIIDSIPVDEGYIPGITIER